MDSRQHTPQVRFKGFSENWVKRELGDIGDFNPYSKLPNTFQYVDLESVSGTELLFFRKESREHAPSRAQRLAKRGDLFYQAVRPYQKNNYLFDLPYNNFVFSTGYIQIRPFLNSHFLLSYVQKNSFVADVLTRCTGTSYPAISTSDLKTIVISTPLQEIEQTTIGNLFQNIDESIVLHRRKYEKTKTLKEALLSRMLMQAEQNHPRIRLEGFSEDWVEAQVDSIFTVTRGQVLAASGLSDKKSNSCLYPVYSSQTKNNGCMGYYKEYLFDTAITWTTDGANAGTVNFREGKFYSTNVNGVLLSNKGYANQAVAEILNRVAYKHVLKVGNPKLMNNVMADIVIHIPSNFKEQERISRIFKKIDDTVVLQAKQLKTLENLKKSLLAKMFV